MTINSLQGSIFSPSYDDADGVAVFIPCGLTAMRIDFRLYLLFSKCVRRAGNGLKVYREMKTGQTIVAFGNPENIMVSMDDAKRIAESALETLAQFSVKRIAMNGIRFASDNQASWQERELVEWVLDWCQANANGFESITFIDLRGGFNFLKSPHAV